jgi:hypothetical protein
VHPKPYHSLIVVWSASCIHLVTRSDTPPNLAVDLPTTRKNGQALVHSQVLIPSRAFGYLCRSLPSR